MTVLLPDVGDCQRREPHPYQPIVKSCKARLCGSHPLCTVSGSHSTSMARCCYGKVSTRKGKVERQGNYDSCGSSPLERSAGDCKGLVCVCVCVCVSAGVGVDHVRDEVSTWQVVSEVAITLKLQQNSCPWTVQKQQVTYK